MVVVEEDLSWIDPLNNHTIEVLTLEKDHLPINNLIMKDEHPPHEVIHFLFQMIIMIPTLRRLHNEYTINVLLVEAANMIRVLKTEDTHHLLLGTSTKTAM
jgi:hypothetical protein